MMKVRSTIDGTGLAVDVEGDGQPIVLLHAIPLSRASWDGPARALASRARVIRFDHRGLGESEVPPGPYLMETLAADCADVMDALGVRRATIVGHSLGGFVAYAFARMFRERVGALGIVQSRSSADDATRRAAREALAERIEAVGAAAVVEAFAPHYLAPARAAADPAIVAALRAAMERTSPAGAAAMLRGMATRVASDDLFDDLAVPVTIVAGRDDAFVPPDRLRADAAAIAGARFELLDCGHLPQWEAPDALLEILERLLADALPDSEG